jgi:hypothetical protein
VEEDGLKQSWNSETVFMNPPYGKEIAQWMAKAYRESRAGATVVCLIPARTDTAWWHDYAVHGEIHYLKGRLKFGDGENSAPFPSAVVIFRPPLPSLCPPNAKRNRSPAGTVVKNAGSHTNDSQLEWPWLIAVDECGKNGVAV